MAGQEDTPHTKGQHYEFGVPEELSGTLKKERV